MAWCCDVCGQPIEEMFWSVLVIYNDGTGEMFDQCCYDVMDQRNRQDVKSVSSVQRYRSDYSNEGGDE